MRAEQIKESAGTPRHRGPRIRRARSRRTWIVGAAAAGFAAVVVIAATVLHTASDDTDAGAPNPIPGPYLPAIGRAAGACPTLTVARLAGQIMANSGFDPAMHADGGRSGIAGLTDETWQRWTPSATADRADPDANIIALAHQMCDLVGQLRLADLPGEPWHLALAAHHASLAGVVDANGVPGTSAAYVDRVVQYADRYAGWYTEKPTDGPAPGDGGHTASGSAGGPSASRPVTPGGSGTPTAKPATTPTPATTTPAVRPSYSSKVISATFVLRPGEQVGTEHTRIGMQPDGDLVIADVRSGRILWRAGTANKGAAETVFQADGTLAVYGAGLINALWSSYTNGNDGAVLVIRADGNVVITAAGGRLLWQSNTARMLQ